MDPYSNNIFPLGKVFTRSTIKVAYSITRNMKTHKGPFTNYVYKRRGVGG